MRERSVPGGEKARKAKACDICGRVHPPAPAFKHALYYGMWAKPGRSTLRSWVRPAARTRSKKA